MTPPNTTSDAELLRLTLAGDESAFTALFRRRQAGVYRFALHMSGSEALAEDVVQEAFIVLIRDGRNFDPSRGSVAAYLYGIARNHVLRAFERERALVPLAAEGDEGETLPDLVSGDDPLGDLTRGEMIEKLRQAVLALPAHYREVVALCELQELSYAEAAAALDCAVGTVRSRLHRARAMLAAKLRERRGREEEAAARGGGAASAGGESPQGLRTARCFA